jgi:hypothetical protein
MRAQEPSTEVFIDETCLSGISMVPLTNLGESATTNTSITRIGRDPEQTPYYIKEQTPDKREYRQLVFLRGAGVAIPEGLVVSEDGRRFATRAGGVPLHIASQQSESYSNILTDTGVTLRQIHEVLNEDPEKVEAVLFPSYATSAHIVDCFYYKHVGVPSGVTPANYRLHKDSIVRGMTTEPLGSSIGEVPIFIAGSQTFHSALGRLVSTANAMADEFTQKLQPYTQRQFDHEGLYIAIPDQGIGYGDFKPENILVDSEHSAIRVIDPVLSRGSTQFDLAKFASRHLLDTLEQQSDLAPFFDGYGTRPQEETESYGPFTFSDLVGMDALNILKSYAKHFAIGHHAYRLTAALESSDFCNAYESLLVDLWDVQTTSDLGDIMYENNNQRVLQFVNENSPI